MNSIIPDLVPVGFVKQLDWNREKPNFTMFDLMMRYDLKVRTSRGGSGKGSRTASCRDCSEHGRLKGNPETSTYFVDKNPMAEQWAKRLNQPYKHDVTQIEFMCFIHYMTFLFKDASETLELVHDYFTNGDPQLNCPDCNLPMKYVSGNGFESKYFCGTQKCKVEKITVTWRGIT